jgi:hypothetical protein
VKETPKRRITVTSSFILNIMGGGEDVLLSPYHFLQQASGHIFKDDVYGFSFSSYFCFMEIVHNKTSANA